MVPGGFCLVSPSHAARPGKWLHHGGVLFGWLTLVDRPFVIFLRSKCYGINFPKCICRNLLVCKFVMFSKFVTFSHNKHNHTTTQPQHTTTKMSPCRPTLQWLWPSPSMDRPAAPLTHGATAPYGPMQGAHHRVSWHRCWFPCLGRCNATHQQQRGGRGLGLRWPPIADATQQSTKSRRHH
jgi:hypothetical protein